ncbi:MAG: L-serine ammonia-lyase, iron-sulfur-dependent subunit beta [Gemmatimonadota bacterium]
MTNLFDILGPTMVGPSSSHTAGACRLGLMARAILGGTPQRAVIGLHGSFAMTGEGHGTRKAIIGGLLGYSPDEPLLRESLERASETGLEYAFETVDLGEAAHPNTARLDLTRGEERTRVIGSSIGGGRIRITEVDDFPVALTGSLPTLLVYADDRPGTISQIAGVFAERELNLATMHVDRTGRGEKALMTIESDHDIPQDLIGGLRAQPWVHWIRGVRRLG